MHNSLVPTTYMMWYITYVHTIHGHTHPYVCLDRGSTHTYLHTKEETHVMHNSLVPTCMMWYITYVHTIHGHIYTCAWSVTLLVTTYILKRRHMTYILRGAHYGKRES